MSGESSDMLARLRALDDLAGPLVDRADDGGLDPLDEVMARAVWMTVQYVRGEWDDQIVRKLRAMSGQDASTIGQETDQ